MPTFEDQLSRSLEMAARDVAAGAELDSRVTARIAGRRRHRRSAAAAGSALALLAASVTAVVAWPSATPRTVVETPASAGPAGGSWSALPAAPIASRSDYTAVWTGTEMIVWGGESDGTVYGDGAAYDPATRHWTVLPSGPLGPRTDAVSVWTGTVMDIFGGVDGSMTYRDGASYDPSTRVWHRIPLAPPGVGGIEAGATYGAWTGMDALLAGFADRGKQRTQVAGYGYGSKPIWEYALNTRHHIPPHGWSFWTGSYLLVVALHPGGGGATNLSGVAYSEEDDSWSAIPAVKLTGTDLQDPFVAWNGAELVAGGGRSGTTFETDLWSWDGPGSQSWTALPSAPSGFDDDDPGVGPLPFGGTTVTAVDDGAPGGHPLTVDPATGSETFGPSDPAVDRQGATPIWDGHAALVWGGTSTVGGATRPAPGESYTPPS